MNRRTFLGGLGGAALAYNEFLASARAQGTSAAPNLKIREIRAVRLRGGFNNRFVRVYTEQGLTGTGEFMDTLGAEYIVNNNISPALAGRDPLDIEGILFNLWGNRLPGGAPSAVFLRGMGGPYLTAISGVEMALWDLAGKALGVPVYRLMGGRVRPKVPVYFDIPPIYQNPDNLKLATAAVRNDGIKMIKSPIDGITRASTAKRA